MLATMLQCVLLKAVLSLDGDRRPQTMAPISAPRIIFCLTPVLTWISIRRQCHCPEYRESLVVIMLD